MARQIIHVDMDAFFASVEQRDDPRLKGKPVIVGGASRRGVVAAASYEARVYGVASAMPMAKALRRCPQAVVIPGRHHRYAEVSEHVFAIFSRYTPLVEGLSLDEAFLDVTHSQQLFGDAVRIAQAIRADIARELELTASAGVASSKFVAKIASDLNKPNGITVVPPDVAAFLAPLPIERMWGIGKVAARKVHEAGLHTIGDLAGADVTLLETILGKWGRSVHLLAQGIDDREVQVGHEQKSVGAEETFEHDLRGADALRGPLLAQAARVARRLFRKGVCGRIVTIKVRSADFTTRSARTTLPEPAGDTDTIYQAALELLERMNLGSRPVRLTGVAVSDLRPAGEPSSLFAQDQKKAAAIEALTSQVCEKFGDLSLTRASILDERKKHRHIHRGRVG